MTKAECAQLVERLDARLRELDLERASPGQGADGIDRTMLMAILEMKAEALRTVREALIRRANGGPPPCAACGDEMPGARLRAHPLAVRCRECEEAAGSSSWFAGIVAAVWTSF